MSGDQIKTKPVTQHHTKAGALPIVRAASEGRASSPTIRNKPPEPTEAQKDHQSWIMGRVDTFLEPFFADRDDVLMDARAIEWSEVLAPLTKREINDAMIHYHREGPKSGKGKLLKPAAGDIYAIAAKARRQKMEAERVGFADRNKNAHEEPEQKKPRMTAERAAEIRAEVEAEWAAKENQTTKED